MKITGVTFAGFYVIAAKTLSSSASGGTAGPNPVVGTPITCEDTGKITSSVSHPNTTVTVTCPEGSKLEPSVPEEGGNNVFLNEDCTNEGVLSSVCPGASIATATRTREEQTKVDVYFPQLPTTQQVVCLKCTKNRSSECIAIITIAPASPQGPQACAAPGKSVTLQVNQAGGSAQFACGKNLVLAPSDPKEAYADDCSKVETLKDMTRIDKTGDYSTLKVDKLTRKKLCYLCEEGKPPGKRSGEGARCTVYVEVSGTRRFSSNVFFGFTLPCLAAMLGFT